MKSVVLYAYDKVNLGDDLFLHTITKRYPSVHFFLWSDKKNKRTFATLENLTVIDSESRLVRFLNQIRPSIVSRYKNWQSKKADAVVYIGGSIFIEYETWPSILNWWNYQADNNNLYILGANFGPYHSEYYRSEMAGVFDKAQDVCFRERYSFDLFQGHQVRWAPDILFTYPMPNPPKIKHQIFFSVINCNKKSEGTHPLSLYQKDYLKNLTFLIQEYIHRGYSIVLSSFCKEEGDEEIISLLEARFRNEAVIPGQLQCLFYDGTNAEKILQAIAESELVLASRFHAMIFGMAAGRPVFPIAYSDKTIHVLQDLGFQGNYTDLRKHQPISIQAVEENRMLCNTISVKKWSREAEHHFYKLDDKLKN